MRERICWCDDFVGCRICRHREVERRRRKGLPRLPPKDRRTCVCGDLARCRICRHREKQSRRYWKQSMALTPVESFLREPNQVDMARYRESFRRDPCAYCGLRDTSPSWLDHIEPRDGANDEWHNLTGACRRCNIAKKNLPLLIALLWLPLSREYWDTRRVLFDEQEGLGFG